ncbi:PD-(D/E)XK nuclease family protein [Colwellia piezophila]|uniref:PD-(D/E)XK nuclease family protein n=1 Tax=Colwellia piezophila TaxID=211668 RepID=UPI000370F67F|nr:PD-(D/E)XK nuclease family protein [Colwellia piezophila]
MNIFSVMSSGDGIVNEANITSVLSYLLDPTEGHGLRDSFLKIFLNACLPDTLEFKKVLNQISLYGNEDIMVKVEIEDTYMGFVDSISDNKQRDIDIVISLYYTGGQEEKLFLVVPIENKIKSDSAGDSFQLLDEYQLLERSIINELHVDNPITGKSPHIHFVYLTPNICQKGLEHNFNQLTYMITEKSLLQASYCHMQWEFNKGHNDSSIYTLLTDLLIKEQLGDIDSVSPFSLLLLKNLKAFIREVINKGSEEQVYWRRSNNAPEAIDDKAFWSRWDVDSPHTKPLAIELYEQLSNPNLRQKTTKTRLSLWHTEKDRMCSLRLDESNQNSLCIEVNLRVDKDIKEVFNESNWPEGVIIKSPREKLFKFKINAQQWLKTPDTVRSTFIQTIIDIST